MVRSLVLAAALLAGSGCVMRATRARDATFHFHPTLDELKAAPRAEARPRPAPRPVTARVEVTAIASGYPQPVGLAYDGGGAFRRVTGVEWGDGELEGALGGALPAAFAGGDGATVHLRGAIVGLAIYRVGGAVYARALLEVRVAHAGTELYAARRRGVARGGSRAELLGAIAGDLADQVRADDELVAALPGGAS